VSRHAPPVPPWDGAAGLLAALAGAPWAEIGRSVEGRPIRAARFGRGPCTLVVGGVHGDEPAAAFAAWRLAEAVLPAPGQVVVVPALNPDGLLRHAKDNARGVDLNRNFPASSFGRDRRAGYDPGPAPASEPETQALCALIGEDPVRILALHQPLACVNYDGPGRPWAQEIAAASGLPVREDLGYPTPGSLGTWLGVERGLPVVTLELGPGSPQEEWPRARRALWAALGLAAAP
jgi:protein MpaA